MIRPAIDDALVNPDPSNTGRWWVQHPGNGCILAYCDTREEAVAYREALNDLSRLLRAVGFKSA